MRVLLLVCLLGAACSINRKQLAGLRRLLVKLDNGVIPTCKIIFFSEQVDYDTADERCRNFKMGTGAVHEGNLATVNDADKNADLQLLLSLGYPLETAGKNQWGPKRWVWAGLRKTKNNGYDGSVSKKKYNPMDWEWADNSHPKKFKQWYNGKQPDQRPMKYGREGCNEKPQCLQNQMRINHIGKWDDTFKFKTHPYACDYQGKYIFSATHRTWPKAREACYDAGLHLAKVRNKAELLEILDAAKFFLGPRNETLKVFHNENWFWIGGEDLNEEGEWKWEFDQEEIDIEWMPWRIPNPDDAKYLGKKGQDVMSISKWGQVDDSFDRRRKRPFACQCPGT